MIIDTKFKSAILHLLVFAGSSDAALRGKRTLQGRSKLSGACTVLEKETLCEGDAPGTVVPCDSDEVSIYTTGPFILSYCISSHMTLLHLLLSQREFACALSDGAIYRIDNDLEDIAKGNRPDFTMDNGADVLQSATTEFSGDADIDHQTGSISFKKGNFGKAKGGPNGSGGSSPFQRNLLEGEKKVLAIKVVTSDAVSTSYSAASLSDSVFGTNGDPVNLKTQYTECSHGKLNFVPKPDSTSALPSTVTNSLDGVTTVNVTSDSTCGDGSASACRNQAISAIQTAFGTRGGADYAMVCVPPGSMSGIAYAYVNSWISVYKDTWCTYPSAQLHEIGHNINLAHSGEGTDQYGDQSGFMGYSYSQDDQVRISSWKYLPRAHSISPSDRKSLNLFAIFLFKLLQRMCFNGPKNWQLGWFSDRHVTLTAGVDSWSGRLYGQTVYDTTSSAEKMIVRIVDPTSSTGDVYVSFNHDALHNINTAEGQNRVLVHNKAGGPTVYAQSWLRAKLAAGGSYTTTDGPATPIVVNAINTAEGWADVTIGAPPTPPPTNAPTTPPPTPAPTTAPPTPSPTNAPTNAPVDPTIPPTPSPTNTPTPAPTNAPTDPTMPPTPVPTSAPTPLPTSPPTNVPTPSPTFAPVDKYICKKTAPSDAEICATNNFLGDSTCPTAGASCGNGGKVCQVASCPSSGPPPPTPPPAPTPTPPTGGCSASNCSACGGGGECRNAGCSWSRGSCS